MPRRRTILFSLGYGRSSPDAAQLLPETKAVVLLDQTEYTVSPNGTAVEHYRRVVKILRPNGRSEGIVRVSFDDDTKIHSLKVWSIGPDGHQYAMKDKDMVDHGYSNDGPLYYGAKFREALPPGRDPGRCHRLRVRAKCPSVRHREDLGLSGEHPQALPELHPHASSRLHLRVPSWAHHATTPVIELEHQHFRWDMPNTPAIDLQDVPLAPAPDSLAGRMTIHYAGPRHRARHHRNLAQHRHLVPTAFAGPPGPDS